MLFGAGRPIKMRILSSAPHREGLFVCTGTDTKFKIFILN